MTWVSGVVHGIVMQEACGAESVQKPERIYLC